MRLKFHAVVGKRGGVGRRVQGWKRIGQWWDELVRGGKDSSRLEKVGQGWSGAGKVG